MVILRLFVNFGTENSIPPATEAPYNRNSHQTYAPRTH